MPDLHPDHLDAMARRLLHAETGANPAPQPPHRFLAAVRARRAARNRSVAIAWVTGLAAALALGVGAWAVFAPRPGSTGSRPGMPPVATGPGRGVAESAIVLTQRALRGSPGAAGNPEGDSRARPLGNVGTDPAGPIWRAADRPGVEPTRASDR